MIPLVFWLAVGLSFCAEGLAQDLSIEYKDHLLSISAKGADIESVFAGLSEKTGILIRYPETLSRTVTMKRDDVTPGEALGSILRGLNYAVLYADMGDERFRITEVRVFQMGESSGIRSVKGPPRRPGASASRRLASYEKRMQQLKTKISSVGNNSPKAIKYIQEMSRLQLRIKKLKQ